LSDLNPVHSQVAATLMYDPSATPPGNVPALLVFGGNADLGPERAWVLAVGETRRW